MQSLPFSAFFLFLEVAAGGAIALLFVYLRGEVGRGFTLFTGWLLWFLSVLALWIRAEFPPSLAPDIQPIDAFWFDVERTLGIAFAILLGLFLLSLQFRREEPARLLGPIVALLALGATWSAALVEPSPQLGGLGTPLAVLAGALAIGSAVVGLSLGHWYLVTPTLSVRPLIRLTFLCLGALLAQLVLLPFLILMAGAAAARVPLLFGEYGLFFAVRVLFGLAFPAIGAVMVWRTARIRSLDSATGIMYVLTTLLLVGEITARSLFFLTGLST